MIEEIDKRFMEEVHNDYIFIAKINEIIKVVNAMERHLIECAVLGPGDEGGLTAKYFKDKE